MHPNHRQNRQPSQAERFYGRERRRRARRCLPVTIARRLSVLSSEPSPLELTMSGGSSSKPETCGALALGRIAEFLTGRTRRTGRESRDWVQLFHGQKNGRRHLRQSHRGKRRASRSSAPSVCPQKEWLDRYFDNGIRNV